MGVALTNAQPGLTSFEEESQILWAVSVGYKQHPVNGNARLAIMLMRWM